MVLGKSWDTSWASFGTGFWIPGPHISATQVWPPTCNYTLRKVREKWGGYDKNALDAHMKFSNKNVLKTILQMFVLTYSVQN